MSTRLTDFLIELSESPKLQQSFRENPRQAMEGAGLTKEDQEVLLSQDPQRIGKAIDKDRLGDRVLAIIFIPPTILD